MGKQQTVFVQVDKPATFNVNFNGGIGTLKSFVKTPSGTEEDVFSQELDQDEHAMRFMPRENGVFYVSIRFNEAHIPGSPFPMLVGKLGADPALVFAKGDGLESGEVGALDICSRGRAGFLHGGGSKCVGKDLWSEDKDKDLRTKVKTWMLEDKDFP